MGRNSPVSEVSGSVEVPGNAGGTSVDVPAHAGGGTTARGTGVGVWPVIGPGWTMLRRGWRDRLKDSTIASITPS